MGRVTEFVLKSVTLRGGGSYNISTGTIVHPTKQSGKKSPKVKSKTKVTKK